MSVQRSVLFSVLLASSSAFAADAASGETDHQGVVGRFGFTWFAPAEVPVYAGGGATLAESIKSDSVTPIGVRWWMMSRLGLDLGLGVNLGNRWTDTTTTATNGQQTRVAVNDPSVYGFALHGGAPFVLSSTQHVSVLAIPEVRYTLLVSEGVRGREDVNGNASRLDLGGRLGAEVHFGFIGMPRLSLQGSLGAAYSFNWASFTTPNVDHQRGGNGFVTSAGNSPWDLFRSNIAAFYYF